MQETQAWSLGQEDPLEKEMTTHSSIFTWEISWTRGPWAGYSPWSWKESDRTYPFKNNDKVIGQGLLFLLLYRLSSLSSAKPFIGAQYLFNLQSSNTLAAWCKERTHWKRPWCCERLRAGGEEGDTGWDGWVASLIQWTWVWANSRRWWATRKPGVLQFMGYQRVGHDWAIKQQQNKNKPIYWMNTRRIVLMAVFHFLDPRIRTSVISFMSEKVIFLLNLPCSWWGGWSLEIFMSQKMGNTTHLAPGQGQGRRGSAVWSLQQGVPLVPHW